MPPPQLPLLDRASSSSDTVCDDDDEELLQLSSSDSSAEPSPIIPKLTLDPGHDGADEISKDLAELEELRKSVQKNLRLRPIRSRGRLPKVNMDEMDVRMPGAFPLSAKLKEDLEVESPTTSVDTPTSAVRPDILSATTPALATTMANVSGVEVLASVTDGMTGNGGVDDMALRTVGGSSTNLETSPSSKTATTTASTSSMPTKPKLKPKNKSKGPPPALVLQDSNTHNSNSSVTSTQPPHIHFGADDTDDTEIIVPPRPPFAQSSLGLTIDTPLSATSPTSSIVSSYFTPVGDTPITSRFIGAYYGSPSGSDGESNSATTTATATTPTEPPTTPSGSFTTSTISTPDPVITVQTRPNLPGDKPRPIPASELYTRLSQGSAVPKGLPRPLVIDTRAPAAHVAYRIRGSINIAIPSLILKRCRKMTASGILRGGSGANPSPNFNGLQTGGGKGGFQNMEALRQFVVGEKAKEEWSIMLKSLNSPVESKDEGGGLFWDGDVIVYDEEMGPDVNGTAWILMDVLMPLVGRHGGHVDYLEGGIMKGVKDTELEKMVEFGPMVSSTDDLSGAAPSQGGKKSATGGLFQLDTKKRPSNIEASLSLSSASTLSSNPTSPNPGSAPRSPMFNPPPLASTNSSSSDINNDTTIAATSIPVHVISVVSHGLDSAPSPPPSSLTFRHYNPPALTGGGLKPRRPSVPNLRRIDTKSAERLNPNLPKLSVRTKPARSATLTIPPRLMLPDSNHGGLQPTSPSHLNLVYSSHSPPASSRYNGSFGDGGNGSFGLTPYYTPPHTPGTPKAFSSLQGSFGGSMSAHPGSHGGFHSQFFGFSSGSGSWTSTTDSDKEKERGYPPSPSTARPEPPSTESESIPTFTISTILPNFLFLGPELTEPGHVEELKELGVKRILNLAVECSEDDHGLKLTKRFDRYVKIPMRDTVEEENVLKGVRQVCEILDDARLHSAPTYVHCKAGKSRSVTAVMAYLIHANHWTLSRAYAFVLERRKGISPNIGFVSELMNFEEQELGGKSIGVQPSGDHNENGSTNGEELAFGGMGLRRGGHIRESLPPLESFSSAGGAIGGDNFSSSTGGSGPMSAGGIQLQRVLVGDQAQETEVKDASGRYRHARRAPVDENTLQPLRRVSKAGLESSIFEELPRGEREREKDKVME